MNPSAPRSSRSSVHSLTQSTTPAPSASPSQSPAPSVTLPLAHQQQHILYGPITTLQPCNAALHPPCIYPAATHNQRGTGTSNPAPLHAQGKSTKWFGKSKAPRSQYCHGHPAQSAHLSYTGKPLVLYDQTQTAPPSTSSSFLVSSSTFSRSQFPSDHYNSSGVALVSSPYFKQPEVQTFCLVQDRQSAPQHNSYYNISATNTRSHQTVNSSSGFQLPNLTPYAVTPFPNNQIAPPLPVQQAQIFQAAPVGLVFGPPPREKHTVNSNLDAAASSKCIRNKLPVVGNIKAHVIPRLQNNEWPPSSASVPSATSSSSAVGTSTNTGALSSSSAVFENCKSPQSISHKNSSVSMALKHPEDRYSEESSVSFDFTLEAEKMVSALCNTTSSNDFGGASGKDENRKTETSYFNGAGDNVANKGNWFADFGMNCSPNGSGGCKAVGTQTQPNQGFTQQIPELIRKTAYWGCSEAETILNLTNYQDAKQSWLSHISSATRTAITKSSTCFPVFAGDRTFVHDLMNSLLRITNGWLILDNYLNKQHYPNLTNKFDAELTRCFQGWEGCTYELLRNVVQTFLKLDEDNASNFNLTSSSQSESQNGSFPGDVSLYTQSDIFGPPMTTSCQNRSDNNFLSSASTLQQNQESAYAVHYAPQPSGVQNFRYSSPQPGQKETKPRTKWTITETLASGIDGTKSVPDVTMTQAESGLGVGKFRAKSSTPSTKGVSRQTLNAEFFDLRNKVMESNADVGKQWNTNTDSGKTADFLFGLKPSGGTESVYRTNTPTGLTSLYSTKASDTTYDVAGTTKSYLQGIDPLFNNDTSEIEPAYSGAPSTGGDSNFIKKFRTDVDYRSKSLKCANRNYAAKTLESGLDSVYLGKSSTGQLELATVPRNKMTLLSQIESSATPRKESAEMAANLTAWFASMRTPNPMLSNCPSGNPDNRLSESFKSTHPRESSRSVIDLTRQLQMDPNKQLQTLQNMQSIQSAPWNACNLINSRSNVQQVGEYDSSEDVRVYMKPGSYNVPKKRHQRRPNRRTDNPTVLKNPSSSVTQNNYASKDKVGSSGPSGTAIKLQFPFIPVLLSPPISQENSPRLLRRRNSSSSQDFPQDITWKAACASAEMLLEALNVKEDEAGIIKVKEISDQTDPIPKCQDGEASSYEASEDDSGSTCKFSLSGVQSKENKMNKTNVKTDSWLIRTLNNASMKQRHDPDIDSSESFNSSVHEDELVDENSLEKLDASLRRSQEPRDEDQAGDLAEGIARATYSETVRRCTITNDSKESCRSRPQKATLPSSCATGNLTSSRKFQRKESDRNFLVHKSRKSIGKRATKDVEVSHNEEPSSVKSKLSKEDMTRFPALKGNPKKKETGIGTSGDTAKNKSGDRGWSVWYSSRRRQSLSPMATKKLELIHQTVWQMEEAQMFKYPPSSSMAVLFSAESIEDYYKIIKNPMFLDTIGYKLKNKVYHKVDHVIRDFRRIISNSRIYHKNDADCIAHVETLSKKLDGLFDEHFSNWDFENITGSPRHGNGSPIPSRYKLPITQKVQRSANPKKSLSVSTNADNTGSIH